MQLRTPQRRRPVPRAYFPSAKGGPMLPTAVRCLRHTRYTLASCSDCRAALAQRTAPR